MLVPLWLTRFRSTIVDTSNKRLLRITLSLVVVCLCTQQIVEDVYFLLNCTSTYCAVGRWEEDDSFNAKTSV